ncbi:MAG: hypothetical protein M3Y06_08365 [Actinomycetota bacterium]|nr:hypothetical protein [Actinomycetota bacterium]
MQPVRRGAVSDNDNDNSWHRSCYLIHPVSRDGDRVTDDEAVICRGEADDRRH